MIHFPSGPTNFWRINHFCSIFHFTWINVIKFNFIFQTMLKIINVSFSKCSIVNLKIFVKISNFIQTKFSNYWASLKNLPSLAIKSKKRKAKKKKKENFHFHSLIFFPLACTCQVRMKSVWQPPKKKKKKKVGGEKSKIKQRKISFYRKRLSSCLEIIIVMPFWKKCERERENFHSDDDSLFFFFLVFPPLHL